MKRLLITGARGQLGSCLRDLLAERSDVETLFTDVAELDLTDADAVSRCVAELKPQYIINCAAYTAVERAEADEATAERVNADAPANLARAAAENGARLIHISTDYVFSGENSRPWRESDEPSPRSAYGRTKLHGEQRVMELHPEGSVILRTAWLYSPYGSNFVKTMLRLAAERPEIRVVADQIGSPTSAMTLARAVLTVVFSEQWHPGVYHLTDAGVASWYDLAVSTLRLSGLTTRVVPITTQEYPTPTERPAYSVLAKEKFINTYNFTLPHWQEALAECLRAMND
ncbi:MAG: dTDP-4-dehydrorhamnose reductase [Muribaculaceae bacterium]|nr:dTDP-4-dehydrorhamnose reductase [Muribaculaceae bacterium]